MAETIEKIYVSSENLGHYDEKSLERQTNAIAVALQSAKDFATGLGDQYDKAGTAATKVRELADGAVKTNTDAIATLNGADTVEGSVAKAVKDAKTELEGKITASKYDDTKIKSDIAANTASIETLNGTGDGSVDKIVADAVAAIVNDAPEAYDTLKEISDWISGHENDASAMNSAIQTNKTDIANLAKLVGTLPEGDASKTIVEYIDSKVATNTAAISALETKVGTLESVSYKPMTNEEIDALFADKAE